LNELRKCYRLMQRKHDVNVIFDGVDSMQMTSSIGKNTPDISKEFLTSGLGECLFTVLGTKDNLIKYLCVRTHAAK